MPISTQIKLMSTGFAAILAIFVVLSSFATEDANHGYKYGGGTVAGAVADMTKNGAVAVGS